MAQALVGLSMSLLHWRARVYCLLPVPQTAHHTYRLFLQRRSWQDSIFVEGAAAEGRLPWLGREWMRCTIRASSSKNIHYLYVDSDARAQFRGCYGTEWDVGVI